MIVVPQILISVGILHFFFQDRMAWPVSLGIFVVAWIGQFIGHKIEGKKPSFIEDIQFLLIGPLWIFKKQKPPQ